MKQFRNPDGIHRPLANYTHQVEVTDERLLFLSGQVGIDAAGHVPDRAAEQLDLALANLLANLRAAGMQVTDLIKLTLYLVGDELDSASRGAVLRARLGEHAPCMTLVRVAGLASLQLKVELDGFAASAR